MLFKFCKILKMSEEGYIRKATHAGSWYTDEAEELDQEMEQYLEDAKFTLPSEDSKIRAIIGPHAGFRWSGPTAAWAYTLIKNSSHISSTLNNPTHAFKRIFLLGPAHKTRVDGAALSRATALETPLGDLDVDQEITETLASKEPFVYYSKEADEKEHSLEMHMPFIK